MVLALINSAALTEALSRLDAGEIEQVIGITELTRMGLDKYQYCAQQRKKQRDR